ncbi:DNA-binding transcriptional regulator, MarR family [Alkalibacterium subtropicum]|uniref:DNA-binding transcriptional regulator, MarR family n=2 Tax=Alkalibacterium subtropicum TaxID=753702 RepID=A0A1I1END3_9LACT|nr:MarR family winged helix-turn-helix transcriptional regulator [Alkalibacterium subtropicum]SFB88614.1 DNA-binding transcriptional regulator, MarR family [Alkalibacterium subtropicum]
MDQRIDEVNGYLVSIFNDVLMIEERTLQMSQFKDVSIKEMHTIDAIGMYQEHTTSEVAKKLGVTVGTLTVSVNNLVRKGYVNRVRSETDRRVVQLALTKRGRLLYRLHDKFHRDMVKETINEMGEKESEVLMHGLKNLHGFLERTKEQLPD